MSQFHPFPRLAPELRLKIWHYALSNTPPRRVTLTSTRKYELSENFSFLDHLRILFYGWNRPGPVPRIGEIIWSINVEGERIQPLLSVNSESRYEMLRYYCLVVNSSITQHRHGRVASGPQGFRICPGLDTLYLDFGATMGVGWPMMLEEKVCKLLHMLFDRQGYEKLRDGIETSKSISEDDSVLDRKAKWLFGIHRGSASLIDIKRLTLR